MSLRLARDQGEEPFGVALPADEGTLVAKMLLELREVPDDPVVGEQSVALAERVGVCQRQAACRCVPDVGNVGTRPDITGFRRESAILKRGDGLLIDVGRVVPVEIADAGAVRVVMALRDQTVWRVEQPERCLHGVISSAHPEQSTHPPRNLTEIASMILNAQNDRVARSLRPFASAAA
jgi:hypothetical protein